jgi:2,4-dichlorophenol 6-monooxygenase
VVIGSEDARDAYGDWRRASAPDVEEDGCLLVRPDGYIAWRSVGPAADDAAKELRGVLDAVLSRTVDA